MEMKDHLLDLFEYNSDTNLQLLEKISQLPVKDECIRLFSHLINSHYKWMARIHQNPAAPDMSWWTPVYKFDQLSTEWEKSLQPWVELIQSYSEEELEEEVGFTGYDGGRWAASPQDIVLQLNYHSIHHRAQIQTIIRQQGLVPDFVDYIGTRYRKIE